MTAPLATLPPYEAARWEDGKPVQPAPGVARWSAAFPPPAIGERIVVTMNNCGPAVVVGYFVEAGWLGVVCDLLDAPDWHKRQNNGDARGHAFGAEISLASEGVGQ